MKWGQPTWMFLHTLSLKLSEEKYAILKKEVFEIIKLLCASLPCPDCAAHASDHMRRASVPPTARDLQKFLFDFHNSVNKNTKKQQHVPQVLELYEKINLEKIFYICQHVILNQPYNPRLGINKMHSRLSLQKINAWLRNQNFLR
jgi:hypothetical protein